MTVDFGVLEVNAPGNYSNKHRTHRTNLIELRYLVWILTQIGKHYLSITCPLTSQLAPHSREEKNGDMKNDKHSYKEHFMC
jgi:hypothetical protein